MNEEIFKETDNTGLALRVLELLSETYNDQPMIADIVYSKNSIYPIDYDYSVMTALLDSGLVVESFSTKHRYFQITKPLNQITLKNLNNVCPFLCYTKDARYEKEKESVLYPFLTLLDSHKQMILENTTIADVLKMKVEL